VPKVLALSAKKKGIRKFLHHSGSTFFNFSSSLLLEYGNGKGAGDSGDAAACHPVAPMANF